MLEHAQCPSIDVIADYVTGDLALSSELAFEQHVADCKTCAHRLQEEASIDVALHELADQIPPQRCGSWSRRITNATIHAIGATAAAASVLLTLGLFAPSVHEEGSSAPRRVDDGLVSLAQGEHLSCIPGLDDLSCDASPIIAQRESQRIPWTELPEPLDSATCWSQEDGSDLICATSDALSG